MQKKIILLIISLFFLSSIWLFQAGQKATDPNIGKNFWTLSFENPKDNSLDFVIENHSEQTDFRYEILKDKEKIKEGDVRIGKGEVYNSQVQLSSIEPHSSGKFIVRVNAGEGEKEIYKIFDK